ncbi:MAG TPA: hypothetical protein VFX18_03280 [Candidatus Nitrosocosmicus sp.]|nr:hypothetical protein [Candidatus Nitrosocosmicus sp.]
MSLIKLEEEEELKPTYFVADVLEDDDDTTTKPKIPNLITPYTKRYHLSAARLSSEYASATNSKPGDQQEKLEYLDDENLLSQFKNNKNNDRIIISEATYDVPFMWRIHDVYRNDGQVARCVDLLVEMVVGRKRTSVILDTNDYYDNDEQESISLKQIQTNDDYRKYVRGISKVNKNMNINEHQKTILTNVFIYGKGALLIVYDDDPLKNPGAMPVAIKPLSSLRIGRVFYYEKTWELAGIEYLDFPNSECIIEPHRLIYMTNKDHHQSPRTNWHGYSVIEPVVDIAETNILNNQTNIKEINRRLWANFLIIKYLGKRKSDIEKFKKAYKPGMPIISNRDFEAQVVEVAHDLEKLLHQMEVSDQKIARDMKIPQMLAGFDSNQAQATAGTVLHAWITSVVETTRTALRNVFEPQWIDNILARLMVLNGDTVESLTNALNKSINNDIQTLDNPTPLSPTSGATPQIPKPALKPTTPPTPEQPGQIHNPVNPQPSPEIAQKPIADLKIYSDPKLQNLKKISDLPFKAKLQYAKITVSTILDTASVVVALHKEGLYDTEIALTEMDREEYIPHMAVVAAQQKIEQQQQFEQQLAANGMAPPNKKPAANQAGGNAAGDAANKVDAMIKSKMTLGNKTSKGKGTAGGNATVRTL